VEVSQVSEFASRFSATVVAGIRTAAAAAVGFVVTYVATKYGIVVPEDMATGAEIALAGAIGGAYNAGVIWLTDNVHRAFGYLLIVPASPSYTEE
jgi:hypothetical protein